MIQQDLIRQIDVEKTVDARIVDLIQAEGTDTNFGLPDPTFVRIRERSGRDGLNV